MAQQLLDLGDAPNDAGGDPLREGGEKINENFTELYNGLSSANSALAQLQARLDYAPPTITAFTASPSILEMSNAGGATTISWALAGAEPSAQTLEGVAVPVGTTSKSFSGQASTNVFDLSVVDADAPSGVSRNSDAASVTVSVLPRRFWGASTATALTGPDVIALGASELNAGRSKSVSIDGGASPGKYVYYAYLASLGDPASYRLFGFDETAVKTTVSVTTSAGLTANYIVLRSPNPIIGAVQVEIS